VKKKINAYYLLSIFSNLFNIPKKNIIFLKNKGHYDKKPTPFKPREGRSIYPIRSNFKQNILQYVNEIKRIKK